MSGHRETTSPEALQRYRAGLAFLRDLAEPNSTSHTAYVLEIEEIDRQIKEQADEQE